MANRVSVFCCSKKSNPFILEVNSGADSQFTIPTSGSGYSYKVSTSDGQSFTGVTGNLTITFPNTNTEYLIEIRGVFPHFNLYYGSTSENWYKVIDVKQWGDVEVKSLEASYGVTINMSSISANDTPNITSIIDGDSCFSGSGINSINNFDLWDMSKFSNLNQFLGRTNYNQPVDWSSPVTGSINTTTLWRVIWNTLIPSFKAQCGNVVTSDSLDFSTNTLSELILIDWGVTLWINNTPLLTGAAIDDLANSVADMTGQTSPTITMTTAQYNSCDTSIWTNKNWTIAQV